MRLSSPCWYLQSFPFRWQLWQCGEAPSHCLVLDDGRANKNTGNSNNPTNKAPTDKARRESWKKKKAQHTLILLSRQGTQAVVTCLRGVFFGFSGSGCIVTESESAAATNGTAQNSLFVGRYVRRSRFGLSRYYHRLNRHPGLIGRQRAYYAASSRRGQRREGMKERG